MNAFDLRARVDARVSRIPDEQMAPFTDPDETTVKATRLELERRRERLRELTPINPDNPNDWSKR